MNDANEAVHLLLASRVTVTCDKCGLPVEPSNDAVLLDVLVGKGDFLLLLAQPRHLLPTGDCPGSPSRAQYLEGQPRDPRPEYPYIEPAESAIRAAYERMQEL